MELPIIDIGNAKGIELSETLLAKYRISDKVELILEEGYIVLKPKTEPRKGWAEAFRQMHENGDDKLLIDDVFADENFDEWNK
jgi:antitoxin MazE